MGLPRVDFVHLHGPGLADHSPELIAAIAAAGRAVLIGTPVAQALFAGDVFRPTSVGRLWSLARASKNHRRELSMARRYRFLNAVPGLTGAQAALAYALRPPEIATAIFGTTQLGHLAENVAAADRDGGGRLSVQ